MRRPVAFDPDFKNRGRGRRRGKVSVDVDAQNLTGSLTFYSPPEPIEGGYIIVSDSNTIKGIGAASAKPVFWTATDATIVDVVSGLPNNTTTISTTADAFSYLSSNGYYVMSPENENIVTDGLVLELDASKKSSYPETGVTWYNLSGESDNGTLTNGPTFNPSGAIELDGSNDYINFSTFFTSNYWSENGDWTISSTHRINDNVGGNSRSAIFANQRYRTETTNGGPGGFGLNMLNGNYCMNLSHDDGAGTTTSYEAHTLIPIVTGSTVSITYTWDGTNKVAKAYKNGELISTTTNSSYKWSPRSYGVQARAGTSTQGGWGNYFPGLIHNIKVYNKALTQDEIKQNYYGGAISIQPSSIFKHFTDTGNSVGKLNGTTLTDLSSASSDFTTEGTVTHDDSYGGVLHLNSGRIYRSQLGWYGKMAVSWWMKYDGAVNAKPFYTENHRTISGCYRISSYLQADGKFAFRVWDNSSTSTLGGTRTAITTTNVCDGEWHHITCQWSNGSGNQPRGMYVYVDGQLEGYTDAVGNDGGYQHWHLGGSYGCVGDNTHNCYLGPVMFYKNYNLTDGEVLQNYNAHRARFGK